MSWEKFSRVAVAADNSRARRRDLLPGEADLMLFCHSHKLKTATPRGPSHVKVMLNYKSMPIRTSTPGATG